ncbi:MAG TPA: iron-sulfur cluster assembly scaffold protein [Verrucomicrobiae bacterium]|nr:iron-sulfur cluster assembly scaffold protein [Verrucomicrobiae bacterium]
MLNVFQQQIIDRSQNPLFKGAVDGATHTAEGANLSCGDELTWQIRVANGIITEIRHQTRACSVCAASADLLAEELQGKPFSTCQDWTTDQVAELLGIPLSPIRLKCALLPLEALKTAQPSTPK